MVRWSPQYDVTVFYRDIIGLPVLETFQDSYGLDGTILGLPGGPVHLEIVRSQDGQSRAGGLDQLVFYLPDPAAQERVMARLAAAGVEPVAQIEYWQDNGGVSPGLPPSSHPHMHVMPVIFQSSRPALMRLFSL